MKLIVIILFVASMSFYGNSQDLQKNSCSANSEIIFLTEELARKEWNNHNLASDYINLIITDSSTFYLGKELKNDSELNSMITENDELPKNFVVVIGIENSVPFEKFSDLICKFESFLTLRINELRVYHFD